MNSFLLIASIIIFVCVIINKISFKVGVPTLVFFIFLGMLLGNEGIGKIDFYNYKVAENICTIALIFIMFYGGFGTNFETAKSVIKESVMLSTAGVVACAFITGILVHLILKFSFWESMLLGSVISSTDAASVFSILKSKKLGIKEHTASVLELESGSNDPFAYMCMIICIMFIQGQATSSTILLTFLAQILIGSISGIVISKLTMYFLKIYKFDTDGFDQIFFVGVAIFSYAFPTYFGGNGFLSSYLVGITLGNQKINNKHSLIHFFDGLTGLMQLLVFFLLGLLSSPSIIWSLKHEFLIVFIILTIISRPTATVITYMFNKSSINKRILVSFCGLRGAASIVFAIMVLGSDASLSFDIFHIVFGIVLLSIILQGSLIPYVTKKLDMIDENEDVLKTFSDYSENIPVDYIEIKLIKNHPWIGKTVRDINLPPDLLVVSIQRQDGSVMPKGKTVLEINDCIVLTAIRFKNKVSFNLSENIISKNNENIGKKIQELSIDDDKLIALIMRNNEPIIPKGDTVILENDIIVLSEKV